MSYGQKFDTTDTKIFVGGLPWTTRNEGLRNFFQQFGEIIHVNVVCDRPTNRSKGYGFVTFKEAESATRACVNPNPIIGGRVANCNIASHGRNINYNQSNRTYFCHDDLCYMSQSFMRNQQQFQSAYVQPYWNSHYQYSNSQWLYGHHPQFVPQLQYSPQYAPQFGPYQYTSYLPNQHTNTPRENEVETSSSHPILSDDEMTSNFLPNENMQN